ncbi:MAG: hypothetical protein ACK5HA_09270 [Planctomycetaceae bacterium]
MAGQFWRAATVVWALMLISGCNRTPAPTAGSPAATGTAATDGGSPAQAGAAAKPTVAAGDPAAAVRQVLQGLEKRRLRAVWDFLPAGYQSDLQRITRQVGARMDPTLWKRAWAIPPRLAKLMRERGDWMLQPAGNTPSNPNAPQPLTATDLNGLADCLDLLASSELGDANRLKTVDLGDWCDRVGATVLGQVEVFARRLPGDSLAQTLAVLSDVQVQSAERAGDEATVQLSTPGGDPVPVEYVRVEGKWIPRDLAEGWIEGMGQAQARLGAFLNAETLAANRPQWESVLAATEEWLGRLEQAEAKEKFDFAWAQGVQNVLTIVAGLSSLDSGSSSEEAGTESPGAEEGPAETAESSPVPLVKVVLKGKYGAVEQDRLLDQLASRVDGGEALVRELAATGTDLILTVGPVEDSAAFAEKLTGWTISKVDQATRTIVATSSPAP